MVVAVLRTGLFEGRVLPDRVEPVDSTEPLFPQQEPGIRGAVDRQSGLKYHAISTIHE